VAITANKHEGVRAAICWQKDIAELSRLHNDANIICIPARFISVELAKDMITVFMNTAFEGGRHLVRVNKINE
jgi:ribose 5-phosphate isomerase B